MISQPLLFLLTNNSEGKQYISYVLGSFGSILAKQVTEKHQKYNSIFFST